MAVPDSCPRGAVAERVHSLDDRRELLRSGHSAGPGSGLGRIRQLRERAARPLVPRGAHSPARLLGADPAHPGTAGDPGRAGHAEEGLAGHRRARDDRPAAADPLERRRHHLARLHAKRYRHRPVPVRPCRLRLQHREQPSRRVLDGRDDGRLALDAPHRAARVLGPQRHPRRVLPGRADRRRDALANVLGRDPSAPPQRPDDRNPAPLHGQLPHLHRDLAADRRRPGAHDRVRERPAREPRRGRVRVRLRGRPFAHLLLHHHRHQLPVLPGADERGHLEPDAGRRRMRRVFSPRNVLMAAYLVFLAAPLLWMLSMSFKPNAEILETRALFPQTPTLENYAEIFTQPAWRESFVNSLIYVAMNVVITLIVAIPAAYAFSRYTFRGDRHLFFWLLTNRMAPGAVFLLPFFQLYSNIGLFDTHLAVALAHTLFSVPLAIWILEGFMSGIPMEIDETAYVDGYSFPRFFYRIFMPLSGPGIGVAAFFSFLFSWVELLFARTR